MASFSHLTGPRPGSCQILDILTNCPPDPGKLPTHSEANSPTPGIPAPCCWPGHIPQPTHAQEFPELPFEAMLVLIPWVRQTKCSLEGQRRPHQGLLRKFTYSWGCLPSKEICSIRTWGHLHVRKSKWVERSRSLAMSPGSKETCTGPWRCSVLQRWWDKQAEELQAQPGKPAGMAVPVSPGGARNLPYKSRKLNRVQGLEALLKLLIRIPGLLKGPPRPARRKLFHRLCSPRSPARRLDPVTIQLVELLCNPRAEERWKGTQRPFPLPAEKLRPDAEKELVQRHSGLHRDQLPSESTGTHSCTCRWQLETASGDSSQGVCFQNHEPVQSNAGQQSKALT